MHARVVARLRPDVLPALGERLVEHLADGPLQMGVPLLELVARLEQAAVHVPEERAADLLAGLEALAAALVDDHLVGVAGEPQPRLVDAAAEPWMSMRTGRSNIESTKLVEPVVHEEREADEAAALLAEVPGEREDQGLRALDQVAVVVLGEVAGRHHRRGLGAREAAREVADQRRRRAAELRGLLGRVARRAARAAARRPGARRTFLPSRSVTSKRPSSDGLQPREREARAWARARRRAPGRAGRARPRSPPPRGPTARRKRRVSSRTSSGRSVCSAHEVAVDEVLLDEHVRDAERERGVAAGLHGNPEVGVHAPRRCSRARCRRSRRPCSAPRSGSARSGSACRSGCRPRSGSGRRRSSRRPSARRRSCRRSRRRRGARRRSRCSCRARSSRAGCGAGAWPAICVPSRDAGPEVPDHAVAAFLDDRVDHRVGDLGERLRPRRSRCHLPEPRSPTRFSGYLTRAASYMRSLKQRALLAAARVEVRHVRA